MAKQNQDLGRPTVDQINSICELVQRTMGVRRTVATELCGAAAGVKRRQWERWASGDGSMTKSTWELVLLKLHTGHPQIVDTDELYEIAVENLLKMQMK